MDSASHSHQFPLHSPLLDALLRTDSSCWCYIPLEPPSTLQCSEGFRKLWQIGGVVEATSDHSETTENRSWLAQSLQHFGIKPCQFFEFVGNSPAETVSAEPAILVRNDHRRLQLSIYPILQQNLVRGHLVRMKDCTHANLLDAILHAVSDAREQLNVLSVRESEILDLVFEGRTNKAISISTTISEKTVEKHRARIMQKLGLLSTAELLRLVTKAKLIEEINVMLTRQSSVSEVPGLYTGGRHRESA